MNGRDNVGSLVGGGGRVRQIPYGNGWMSDDHPTNELKYLSVLSKGGEGSLSHWRRA